MLNRKLWSAFFFLIFLIVGIAYFHVRNLVELSAIQIDTASDQRLIQKSDGNLDALERYLIAGDLPKVREILKGLAQGERVVCASVFNNKQNVFYPDTCDLTHSEKTLTVTSEAGTTIKIDTGISLAEEQVKILSKDFLLLLISLWAAAALFYFYLRNLARLKS